MRSTLYKFLSVMVLGLSIFILSGCGGGGGGSSTPTLKSIKVVPVSRTQKKGLPENIAIVNLKRHFMAIASYSDGSQKDVTKSAVWSSSAPSIMEPISGEPGLFMVHQEGKASISAEMDTVSSKAVPMKAVKASLSITVSPQGLSLPVGVDIAYSARAVVNVNGKPIGGIDITNEATWKSDDTKIVKINPSGVATTLAAGGPVTIAAIAAGYNGSAKLTVTPATLQSIQLTFADGTTAKKVPIGTSGSFEAIAFYDDGSSVDVTDQVKPDISDTSVVEFKDGYLTAMNEGTATITVTYQGIKSNAITANVSSSNVKLKSITVSPTNLTLPRGNSAAYKATGTYSDGTVWDITHDVEWDSSDMDIAYFTGNTVNTIASGNVTISAKMNGIRGTTALNVSKATLVRIQLTFSDGTTAKKVPVGTTGDYKAIAFFSDGSFVDITEESVLDISDPKVVGIGVNDRLVALSEGSANITVTYQSVKSNAITVNVTSANVVLQSITISPVNLSLPAGVRIQYTATGHYSDGSSQDITRDVSWESNDLKIATINEKGVAYGINPGMTTITATKDGKNVSTELTIEAATLKSLVITTANGATDIEVPIGTTGNFVATAYYDDGSSEDVTEQATWSSSEPKVVGIVKTGMAKALSEGTSLVTATFEGIKSNEVTVKVKPVDVVLESITLSPSGYTMPIGESVQFTATGHYSDGTYQDITNDVTWSSSDDKVATVDAKTGEVRAVAEGTATITATLDGISEARDVRVKAATVKKLQLTFKNGETSATVPVGTTGQLVVTAIYSDGSTSDVTQQNGVYYTFDSNIVDIKKNGAIRAIAAGSTGVTAKYSGVSSNEIGVTVNAVTLESINVSANDTELIEGTSTSLTAIGTFSDGTTADITKDVTWESSDVNVVSIVGNEAKGNIPGQATITATLDHMQGSLSINVVRAQVTSLKIVEDGYDNINNDFVVGQTIKVKALASFDNGIVNKDVTDKVVWSSSPSGVVTVDNNGLITAIAPGNFNVMASYQGEFGAASDTISGHVVKKTIKEIIVFSEPNDGNSSVGVDIRLEAWAKYNDGTNQNISDTVKWISDNQDVMIEYVKDAKYVWASASQSAVANITAEYDNIVSPDKTVRFEGRTPDHIEIQEGYCGDGNCPVITGKTIDIPIVDNVNYEPVSEGAYYPTAWLVFSDGSKEYINTERGIRWWSADQVRAYVNTTKGSFVFGRGLGNGIEISVSYRGDYRRSFFVNVKEDTSEKTLKKIGIKNTKDLGWGCTQNDKDYGTKLRIKVGDNGKYLMACGQFEYANGTVKWEDINDNVAWFSSNNKVARVRTYNGELQAIGEGDAVISAQLAKIKGATHVTVTKE